MKGLLLIIDTREKDKKQLKRIKSFCDRNKIDFVVKKLDFGDYSFEYEGVSYEKEFILERKKTFDELIMNLSKKDIGRFSREFERAKNCKIILFVEQSKTFFEKHKYRSKIPPKVLGKKIRTFLNKYMIEFHLVKKVDTAKFIFKKIQGYLGKGIE
jgi:ERCC4-type nuclease